ncbi:hypothetical protein DYB26_014808, partial [Aphanomyces astaci]
MKSVKVSLNLPKEPLSGNSSSETSTTESNTTLTRQSKAVEDSDEAAETTSITVRRELASLLDDESDLGARSSAEELVYTDHMVEASSDENKSDESMLTEGNDDDTLTQSVVPFTST